MRHFYIDLFLILIFYEIFRTMQLKKIKRAEKKGTESVMDEKFALLFYTSVIVNDYRIRVSLNF